MTNSETQLKRMALTALTGESIHHLVEREERLAQEIFVQTAQLPIKNNYLLEGDKAKTYHAVLAEMGIELLDIEADDLFMDVALPNGWELKQTDHSLWSNLLDDQGRVRGSIFHKGVFYDRDAFFNFTKRFSISTEIADYDKEAFRYKPPFIPSGAYEEVLEPARDAVEYKENGTFVIHGEPDEYVFGGKHLVMKRVKKPIMIPNPAYVELTGYEKYSEPVHFDVLDYDDRILFSSSVVQTDFVYSKARHWEFFDQRDALLEKAKKECQDWLDAHYPNWNSATAHWDSKPL